MVQAAEDKVKKAQAMVADSVGSHDQYAHQLATQVAAREKAERLVEKLQSDLRKAQKKVRAQYLPYIDATELTSIALLLAGCFV